MGCGRRESGETLLGVHRQPVFFGQFPEFVDIVREGNTGDHKEECYAQGHSHRYPQKNQLQNSLNHFYHLPFTKAKANFEKNYIDNLMKSCNGDVTKVADLSEIKRQNIYEKFKKYDIDPAKYRDK